MKPAPFEYADPLKVADVLQLLRERGDEAKILAGGQSLVPLLNMRMAQPELVVDINRVDGFDSLDNAHGLTIGPTVRQRRVERDQEVVRSQPLLAEAIQWVGHAQIRTRGTVVGSLAHADPAAEMPVVWQCLDGTLEISSSDRSRTVAAREFFVHIMTTDLDPDEMVVGACLPPMGSDTGTAFLEVARRHGDFAMVSVATALALDGDMCRFASIAIGGVAPVPLRASQAERFLVGEKTIDETFIEAGVRAAAETDPPTDIHGSADYRREVAGALVERALGIAAGRARERAGFVDARS